METSSQTLYSKTSPFLASLKQRKCLNHPNSKKRTYHLNLDISSSNINYKAGDCLAILPQNDPTKVDQLLEHLNLDANQSVYDHKKNISTLKKLMLTFNLSNPNKKILTYLAESSPNEGERNALLSLLAKENKKQLISFCNQYTTWDLLLKKQWPHLVPQDLCKHLSPLLPRFYSIASSPSLHPNEVHLTVAHLQYECNQTLRYGVCTHFLCHLIHEGNKQIPIYLQPTHSFCLPEDPNKSIIMIGPGTGIAPFRAFIQERITKKARGKNWLFFGERNRAYDFYYREEWQGLQTANKLKLSLAFSRDQKHKIYVQNRMYDERKDVWRWIQEGAYLYVCGDAKKMAKDVEATLLKIIEEEGNTSPLEAKHYLKNLRKEKRYQKDVY